MGINPAKANITAPAIQNFQTGQHFTAGQYIEVPKGKGLLLIIE